MKRIVVSVVALVLGLSLAAARVHAQGVTTAALAGLVTDDAGAPVGSVEVVLTNTSTGQRWQTRTRDDGRYIMENVAVGGPYTILFRALGFEPKSQADLYLRLGQRLEFDAALKRVAVQVSGVTVEAEANPLVSPARTGPQTYISDSSLRRLPTLTRNFTDFIQLSPQVVGTSVAGQNNRYNNIQIDGGVNNDLFGLAASGTPGGQANAHPISIEAVKEYQVLVAPFDVRQGSFTGGLINAVTRSGSNEFHGSLFAYMQNRNLTGPDSVGKKIAEFTQNQYGFSVSGPIVRDRLHFFVAGDFQGRGAPFVSPFLIGDDTTGGADSIGVGIRKVTADTTTAILRNQYGFDPGDYHAPRLENPDGNWFAKLTGTIATNNQIEVSYNRVDANQDNLIRNPTATGFRDGYQLSNSGYNFATLTSTLRGKWTALFNNGWSTEVLLGYQTVRDKRDLPNRVPLIFVGGDRAGTNLAAGADRFSHANSLDQDITELTASLTLPLASRHLLTVGTHNEFFHFNNVFFPASIGVWSFANPDSLTVGHASRYEIALPGDTIARPNGAVADFNVRQLGFYAQDRWNVLTGLSVTLGARMDVPTMADAIPTNARLDSAAPVGLGINTADFPSGNQLWSWRAGFNWDATHDQQTVVRGGVGTFAGRPPYVWLSNAYSNTGLEQKTLTCTGASVPAFTVNPDSQPTVCGAGATPPTPSIVVFDKGFKFPQVLKAALGFDRQLGNGLLGTMDFVYTKSLQTMYQTDDNLVGVQGTALGEGGRVMYGTIASNGSANLLRKTANFRDVIRHSNKAQDRSYSFTAQLRKLFPSGLEFAGAYTYSRTEDVMSLTSSIASSNLRFAALDGTLAERNLRTSAFDVPHKITVSGSVNGPGHSRFSLIYIGVSGTPYTYVVSNDANADGLSGNDIVYVPRTAGDITLQNPTQWGQLNSYINGEPCLRQARGRIMERNTCRNPWVNTLNARVSFAIPTVRAQSLEAIVDIFNVLNLLSPGWGLVRQTSAFEENNLLRLVGWDAAYQRGVYALNFSPANRNKVLVDPSRYRVQLGLRYSF